MQIRVDDPTVLRAPATVIERAAAAGVAIDPAAPNWIATDERGLRIFRYLDGRTPRGEVVRQYADDSGLDLARAWLHVDTFTRDALRQRFISTDGAVPVPLGRATYLRTDSLREFWIQVNDFCNLACEHCLVRPGVVPRDAPRNGALGVPGLAGAGCGGAVLSLERRGFGSDGTLRRRAGRDRRRCLHRPPGVLSTPNSRNRPHHEG